MSLTLSLILPKEHAVLTSVLASYFEETASKARVDPGDRARQMLHRKVFTPIRKEVEGYTSREVRSADDDKLTVDTDAGMLTAADARTSKSA